MVRRARLSLVTRVLRSTLALRLPLLPWKKRKNKACSLGHAVSGCIGS